MKVTLMVVVDCSEEMGWGPEAVKEEIEAVFSGYGDMSVVVTIVDDEEE